MIKYINNIKNQNIFYSYTIFGFFLHNINYLNISVSCWSQALYCSLSLCRMDNGGMFCTSCILTNNYNDYCRRAIVTNLVVTWRRPSFYHESVITGVRHAMYVGTLRVNLSRDPLSSRRMKCVTRSNGETMKCKCVGVQGCFCAYNKGLWARRCIYPYVFKLGCRWMWVGVNLILAKLHTVYRGVVATVLA
jgi:hypothetical protein